MEVDGQDQCIFWGDFRASFLPKVEPPRVTRGDGYVLVESSHDGYRRLPDPVVHNRAYIWIAGHGLVVVDRLRCRRSHRVCSRLQLAPGRELHDGMLGPFAVAPFGMAAGQEPSAYAPFLGTRVRSTACAGQLETEDGRMFGWSLLRPGATVERSGDRMIEVRRASDKEPLRIALRPLE